VVENLGSFIVTKNIWVLAVDPRLSELPNPCAHRRGRGDLFLTNCPYKQIKCVGSDDTAMLMEISIGIYYHYPLETHVFTNKNILTMGRKCHSPGWIHRPNLNDRPHSPVLRAADPSPGPERRRRARTPRGGGRVGGGAPGQRPRGAPRAPPATAAPPGTARPRSRPAAGPWGTAERLVSRGKNQLLVQACNLPELDC